MNCCEYQRGVAVSPIGAAMIGDALAMAQPFQCIAVPDGVNAYRAASMMQQRENTKRNNMLGNQYCEIQSKNQVAKEKTKTIETTAEVLRTPYRPPVPSLCNLTGHWL
jgi:hypothetical protein